MFQLNFHTGKPQSRLERIHILTHHIDMCIPVHWLFIRLFIQRTKYDNLVFTRSKRKSSVCITFKSYIASKWKKKAINEIMYWVMSLWWVLYLHYKLIFVIVPISENSVTHVYWTPIFTEKYDGTTSKNLEQNHNFGSD